MRAVGQLLSAVAATLAEVDAHDESAGTTGHVDRSSTGKVEGAELVAPSVRVPGPGGNGVVHEGGPAEDEEHCRGESVRWGGSCFP